MVFLKSFVAGLVALAGYVALLCLVIWFGPILWLLWQMWRSGGEGDVGAVSYGFQSGVGALLLIPGLLVFAAAFRWEWGRAAR
jgi:hypothetical protein